MMSNSLNSLKVSKKSLLITGLIFISIFCNRGGYADSKIRENSSNTNYSSSSHPLSTPSSTSSSSYLPNNASSSPQSHYATSLRYSILLQKINLQNESHAIAQLTQSGTANLHKLLQKLQKIASSRGMPNKSYNNATSHTGTKVVSGKLLGMNKIASSIPSFITNNTRLKRQLEGIFHVRGTATSSTTSTTRRPNPPFNVTTTPPSISNNRTLRYNRPPNGSLVNRIRNVGHGRNGTHNATNFATTANPKKEIGQTNHHKSTEDQKITTIANFQSKKSNARKTKDSDEVLSDLKGNRNFTVEIVEIARKTVIKEDNNNSGKYRPTFRPLSLTSPATLNTKPVLVSSKGNQSITQDDLPKTNSKPGFKPTQPRVRTTSFTKPKRVPVIVKDSSVSATQPEQKKPTVVPSVKYKSASHNTDLITSSTTAHPISESGNGNTNPRTTGRKNEAVEVKVNYQEQIAYNDRDVDEADLQDYLDGHSTFGAKGDFKHTVSKNSTGYLPNSQDNTKAKKTEQRHELRKRQQPHNPQPQRRSSSRDTNNDVDVERAKVKQQRGNNPKATVYTATGVPVLDQEDKNIYEYSGKKENPHHFPKLPKSALDALYHQGHPAVAKAPLNPAYKEEEPEEYNPFRANPLVDDPPLKYDPESDRFYGNPTPDKDKLAQSNRPEPVQIQSEDPGPEYQENDEQKKSRPQSRRETSNDDNKDNDKYHYERVYEPPEQDYNDRTAENEEDTFIKDFVSLDNNFQPLPRPSADEENFKGLIAPEAQDENDDDAYFEPDNDNRRQSRKDESERKTPSSTSRSNDEGGERGTRSNPNNNEGGEDDYPEGGGEYEGADDEEFGTPTEDFDQSYVDALKQFDDEIQRIQNSERDGATTAGKPPPTSTGEPLVITSPGPAVSYQPERNAPPPPRDQGTTPTHQEQDEAEDENEEDQLSRRPDSETAKDDEEPEEPEEENEESTPISKDERKDEDGDDKSKDADESQHVKIKKVVEVKSEGLKDDKSGNLDDDIKTIETEFQIPQHRSQ